MGTWLCDIEHVQCVSQKYSTPDCGHNGKRTSALVKPTVLSGEWYGHHQSGGRVWSFRVGNFTSEIEQALLMAGLAMGECDWGREGVNSWKCGHGLGLGSWVSHICGCLRPNDNGRKWGGGDNTIDMRAGAATIESGVQWNSLWTRHQ